VNLSAVFRLCQASIPSLKQSTRGRIVNIGSIMTTLAGVGMGAYTTSKHAVAGLTKTLALELGEFGITANFIQPGAIITGITQASLDAGPEFERFWSEKSALGRLGRPEDIAAAINFLVSEDASFITGHGLVVDGGVMRKA
ncbi:MAG: SDR family oxidoreductase, partial [Pseudomonadales bacterium]